MRCAVWCVGSLIAMPGASVAQSACDSALQVSFSYAVSGNTIVLTDQSSNLLTDVHYYWIYGDGVVDHLGSGMHTYADTGTYQVCLSVSGNMGTDTCAGLYCETVLITNNVGGPVGFAIGPVPFTEVLFLYGAPDESAVTLYDASGHVAWQGTPTAEAGRLRLEPTTLAPGAYTGTMSTATGEQRFRVVKAQR